MDTQIQTRLDEERRIVARVRGGDTRPFATLVERYHGPVYNLMYRMTHSEDRAVDLAQETFVRAFERLEDFNLERAFFPWLYTLGLNLARDYLRKYGREDRVTQSLELLSGETEDVVDPAQPYDEALDRASLELAMDALPLDTREALMMRFREGFSYQEISDALDIGLSTAKMKIHRGLALLRGILGPEENV